MSFVAVQESLRKQLRKRIAAGELTGLELARRTGFTQAHISNFLNRKRGLKLIALDRTIKAVGLSLYDLLDPHDLARFAAIPADVGRDSDDTEVPVVSPEAAASREVIIREDVRELLRYKRALLGRIRPDLSATGRRSWARFVALEAGEPEAAAMSPRFSQGSVLLVDRHYTTLRPYRKNERNLYAVQKDGGCVVRYVEESGDALILRPHKDDSPVEVVPLAEGRPATDCLIGRIAHLSIET